MTSSTGPDNKRQDIANIFAKLIKLEKLPLEEHFPLLQKLKVYGREPLDSDQIYHEDGLEILAQYALRPITSKEAAREALATLANATVLRVESRQMMVLIGVGPGLAHHVGEIDGPDGYKDEFLYARLLLMLTDKTSLDYCYLVDDHGLAKSVNKAIEKHANGYYANEPENGMPNPKMALAELLKLEYGMFNFHRWESYAADFAPSIPSLLKLFHDHDLKSEDPMESPFNHVIHALFKFDQKWYDKELLYPKEDPRKNSSRLLDVLRMTIDAYDRSELDLMVPPALGLLGEMYKPAPEEVRVSLRASLLPSDEERAKPLGQADTLPGKLLRLSTSGYTPELRKIIPTVLFELSDTDPEKFVKNVGYGNAAGFLHNNQIPLTAQEAANLDGDGDEDEAEDEDANADADASEGADRQVNPITGQFVSAETPSSLPPLTQEEKEYEAERLFVLFERLKATGVMDVQNPVEEALRSGRFEEIE